MTYLLLIVLLTGCHPPGYLQQKCIEGRLYRRMLDSEPWTMAENASGQALTCKTDEEVK